MSQSILVVDDEAGILAHARCEHVDVADDVVEIIMAIATVRARSISRSRPASLELPVTPPRSVARGDANRARRGASGSTALLPGSRR